MIFLSWYS